MVAPQLPPQVAFERLQWILFLNSSLAEWTDECIYLGTI
ncbi:hypothetical protein GXM_09586 [Nostoc sphaeroides CCNUC1]|uniref:Uncharacterized protein n=1 Tax=Nostoc sphaeroides CCNUC1 TaxID=2653204 RepID=A0A5P8WFF7_9NOSO|nr:hypothetical protein GXM_09061 [Nostoc sphaeroides CCNUC1]QFS52092.1 hypothetical protein GXM_09586 [Nostoc sphaeroides CCNUC1]